MPAREPSYRVVNRRAQPVELHVAAEAVVLPPGGEAELDLVNAQVAELARRGIVSIEPAGQRDEPPGTPEEPSSGPETSARSGRRRATTTSSRTPSRRGGD
jgi:hypothetical protein